MADRHAGDPPSAFVVHWATVLSRTWPPARSALDVAMGHGRHALVLARAGFRVFGVDVNRAAVAHAVQAGAREGHLVRGWCADLRTYPLPRERFQLVIVTRYLQRDLFASLREVPRPGGVVVYETFTEAQRLHGRGPTSPDHLLKAGELREWFQSFDVEFYEEADEPDAAVARLVARRR